MARAGTVAMVAEAAADADVRSVGETEAVAAVETGAETVSVAANGETVLIPLNKLKKSPRNARKTPHSEAEIEAYAAANGEAPSPSIRRKLSTAGAARS